MAPHLRALGYAWLLMLVPLAGSAEDPKPGAVDARLYTVASRGTHRLLVYRICSPEHCWSQSYLQWLEQTSPEPIVKATTPVTELGYGSFVTSARWTLARDEPQLEVRVAPSHGEQPERTRIVIPREAGGYVTRWKEGGAAGRAAGGS
ncbi:MAG: hypothetical protein JRH01_11785 [Deltaproteobacteria bacterium]|nr:hypothetical protein [Deltaproteobacteria bacterium]